MLVTQEVQIEADTKESHMAQCSNGCASHNYGLPRAERLRGRASVSKLFDEGESGFVFPIKYLFTKGSDCTAPTSVLFTVPKRYHKRANKRNLLRRRMKEAYRLNKSLLGDAQQGLNIALIYTTKELHDYRRISHAITKVLNQIISVR